MLLSSSQHIVFPDDVESIEDIEKKKELRKVKITIYIIYAVLVFIVPRYIIFFYSKLSSFLINNIFDFTEEDITKFLNS